MVLVWMKAQPNWRENNSILNDLYSIYIEMIVIWVDINSNTDAVHLAKKPYNPSWIWLRCFDA